MKPLSDPCLFRLENGLATLGLDAGERQVTQLIQFTELLRHWNRAYNLTAIHEPLEMVSRHLLDSLAVCPYLKGTEILDLGTGAGLPGIPLAILNPGIRFFLLDSNGKKIRFVRQAIMELGLTNVQTIQTRMESYRPIGKFATIISRAAADLETLWRVARLLLASPGTLLIMKGRWPADAITTLTTHSPLVHRLEVPFLGAERHLIEIRHN